MNPQRLEFLKKLIRFFRQNPRADHYGTLTREDCFSLIAYSLPSAAISLDPQDPNFLAQAEKALANYNQEAPQEQPALPRQPAASTPTISQGQPTAPPKQPQQQLPSLPRKKYSQKEIEELFNKEARSYISKRWPRTARALKIAGKIANIPMAILSLPWKFIAWVAKKIKTITAVPVGIIGKIIGFGKRKLAEITASPRAKIGSAVRKVTSLPDKGLAWSKKKLLAATVAPRTRISGVITTGKERLHNFTSRGYAKVNRIISSNRYMNKTKRVLGKASEGIGKVAKYLKFLGKISGVVTTIWLFWKVIKKILKYIVLPIFILYALAATLGTGALIGAVLGSIIGGALGAILLSPLLAIPIVGPALYAAGVGLFTLGGTAAGLFIGYAIEHWIWPQVKNIWTATANGWGNLWTGAGNLWAGAGNALTGAWTATGNFLGGLWTGAGNLLSGAGSLASGAATAAGNALTGASTAATTWASGAASNLSIGAANLASSAFSAAGSAITATGGAISGFVNALSGISLAQSATVPVLGAVGVAGGFTLFLGPMIVGTGFMRPPPPAQITVPPSPYGACSLTADTAPRSTTLTKLFIDAGQWAGIPPAVLAAIAYIEGGYMFGYTDAQIQQYSAPGAQDPTHCYANGCGAWGPMQFLNDGVATDCGIYTGKVMPDTWSAYSSAVNEALPSEPRTPEVCNIKDSIYAAAKLIKRASGVADNTTCVWDRATIDRVATAYYGSTACTEIHASLGNQTYCQFVWDYYQAHSVQNPPPPPPVTGWFFWQGDPQWGWYSDNLICSPPATIGNNGCGPTSLAMVFTRFGVATSPTQMYDEFISRNAIGCAGSYNYQSTFIDLPLSRGFSAAQGISKDWAVVESYIRNGYLVIASTNQYSASGHLLVIKDIQGDNVITNDPAIPNGEGKSYTKTEVVWYAFWALKR